MIVDRFILIALPISMCHDLTPYKQNHYMDLQSKPTESSLGPDWL